MASFASIASSYFPVSASAAVEVKRTADFARIESASFQHALVALAAKLAAIDGIPNKSEYMAFQALFVDGDADQSAHARSMFIRRVHDDSPALQYARQLAAAMPAGDDAWSQDLMRRLLQVALADGALNAAELELLRAVADIFRMNRDQFRALIATAAAAPGASPYEVLGISSRATDAELRDHYMALVQKLHPDRYHAAGASGETVAMLSDRLATINGAYHAIQKQRAKKSGRGEAGLSGWWNRLNAKGARTS